MKRTAIVPMSIKNTNIKSIRPSFWSIMIICIEHRRKTRLEFVLFHSLSSSLLTSHLLTCWTLKKTINSFVSMLALCSITCWQIAYPEQCAYFTNDRSSVKIFHVQLKYWHVSFQIVWSGKSVWLDVEHLGQNIDQVNWRKWVKMVFHGHMGIASDFIKAFYPQ